MITTQPTYAQRKIADIQRIRGIVSLCERTGLCAVCRSHSTYEIRPGVKSMTCGRMQCRRAWLLGEPWRCPECKSMDFERLEMQWDSEGRKLYHCNQCQKTYAIHHRTFETVTEAEAEATNEKD